VGIAAILTQVFYKKSMAIDSVAVLPLENLTGDPEKEYFADGVTDELITRLGRVGAVNVISRQSVKRYKNSDLPLEEIANELHVDAVVEGSLRLDGDRVFISAQLVDARRDRQIWANTLEGDISDVMSLQSQVAQAVSEKLRVALTSQEISALRSSRTVDPVAYDKYLKANHYRGLYREPDLRRAIQLYREAIDIDPTYAPAYAGLAVTYLSYTFNAHGRPQDMIPMARAAAEKALELDASVAEAHTALASIQFVYDWDWKDPERGFTRAVELNPNSNEAHGSLGTYYILTGRADKGIAEIKRMIEIDPLSVGTSMQLGWGYFTSSRFDEAIAALEKTRDMDRGFAYTWEMLAWSYAAKGMAEEAIAAADTAISLTPKPIEDTVTISGLAWVYAISGEREKAVALHNRLLQLRDEKYVDDWYLAQTYAALGEVDSAFAYIERAVQARSPSMVFMKVTPEFDSLRDDPRFDDLMRRVGIPLD
jgi:TolB-like protein/Tfp pilus assembly protein PilF